MRLIPGMQGWFSISKSINVNRLKKKNSKIVSIDAGKTFNKIHYPFMIKKITLSNKGKQCQLNKEHLQKKSIANMLHGKELDRCFLANIRNKARCLLAPLLFNINHRKSHS